jgi:hypothetical protein
MEALKLTLVAYAITIVLALLVAVVVVGLEKLISRLNLDS